VRPSRGLSALPVILAIMVVAILSLFIASAVMRAQLDPALWARELAAQGAEKRTSWLKAYVYDVDLCELLRFQGLVLKNKTLGNITIIYGRPDLENQSAGIYSVQLSSPTRILIINEGPPVEIEVLAFEAFGALQKELRPGVELKTGEYLVYLPGDLGLPESVDALYHGNFRIVAYTSLQESIEIIVIFTPPDPAAIVAIDPASGKCIGEV